MAKIAIVDDEQEMLEIVSKCMKESIQDIRIEIETFTSAEEFLKKSEEEEFDILVTDIDMPGMDGMELGRRVRAKQSDMSLVFLTSYSEYAVESYKIDADQYIVKCNMEERLPVVINHLVEKRNKKSDGCRAVRTPGKDVPEKYILHYKDIIYISKMKASKYVRYIGINGVFTERITLESLKKQLPEDMFVMVDRSYIVNMRYIVKMRNNTIYLKDDYQVGVSRSHAANVKQQIHNYGRIQ